MKIPYFTVQLSGRFFAPGKARSNYRAITTGRPSPLRLCS
jgi:hypothetical protein